MQRTAVVILNYNTISYLQQFLPSVLSYSGEAQIVVADNASTDGSAAWLRENYPQVRLISHSRNEGFSRGYNLALGQVEADYYVLLNSDVEVTPGWLQPLTALMDEWPGAAACQPKIRSFAGKGLFEYAGAAGGFLDKWGYPFCRGRIFTSLETDHGQYDDDCSIDWATGACMVVRARTFWEAGGLDDAFFAHMEEIDLCWRLRNMGYRIMYSGKSTVYHVGGGTLSKAHPRKTYLNFRNGIVLLYKNLPQRQLVPVIITRLVLDGLAACKLLLSDGPAHFLAVIQAHFGFYGNFSEWAKQRKAAQRISGGSTQAPQFRGSIVWHYFFLKRKKFSQLPAHTFREVRNSIQ
jgi:GT2 family glycosyltransferase